MTFAKFDLKILETIKDEDLYKIITIRQPLWSNEIIQKEIKNLRSHEFAEWYINLLREVNNE